MTTTPTSANVDGVDTHSARPAPPRYFVSQPTAGAPDAPTGVTEEAGEIAHVIDVLRVQPEGAAGEELIVGVDLRGRLRAAPGSARTQLRPRALAQLSHHELAVGGRPRTVRAQQLWLLDAQDLEVPESGGPLDPVNLHGVLLGPFAPTSRALPPGGPALSVEGQLVCGRADLLWRFVEELPHAFRYASGGTCQHLTLPGGRADEVRAGHAIVLAYPMPPPELATEAAANDEEVLLMLYELLCAVDEGLRRAGDEGLPPLPVPSRALLEHRLRAEGWQIEGDRAVRRSPRASAWRRLFGPEKRELPPEGTREGFLALAHAALERIPGWPDERARALADRLAGVVPPPSRADLSTGRTIPRADAGPGVTPPPPPPITVTRAATLPDDWRRDFDPSPATAVPEPAANRAAEPTSAPASDLRQPLPDWMRDFE